MKALPFFIKEKEKNAFFHNIMQRFAFKLCL